MKVIIIGGVAGGASAAARIRRLDEKAEIVLLERSGYISYANCGLPYYIGGTITDKNSLTLQTPESFQRRFRVDVRVLHEALKIDTAEKTVTVRNIQTGEIYQENYDKLLLSPGAKPVIPAFAPIESDNIFTLRTVEDALRIRAYIERQAPKSALIIGGGFIGLEMAENLVKARLFVTLLQRSEQIFPVFDRDMASFLHAKCRAAGVNLRLQANVTEMQADEKGVTVTVENMAPLRADMAILAIGVTPENTLAKEAGLTLGEKGTIAVNNKMETSAPNVYAVGDAVEILHTVTEKRTVIALAGPANKQARIAADNICGKESHYAGAQGSSILKLFDMTVASTGIGEKTAHALGLHYEKVILSPSSHASYYPSAKVMTMKILYEKGTKKLLGAQIIGYDGVDKRIDVLATAIFAGLAADRLKDLDLAYAPPYSSAKDPINMAGFIIDNIENGIVKQFYYEDIASLRKQKDAFLLDTRTPMEYLRGHADGFAHIPLDELRERLSELPRDKKIYVMCQSGLRSYLATRILIQNGFDAYNFAGGYRFYESVKKDCLAAAQAYPCGMES